MIMDYAQKCINLTENKTNLRMPHILSKAGNITRVHPVCQESFVHFLYSESQKGEHFLGIQCRLRSSAVSCFFNVSKE